MTDLDLVPFTFSNPPVTRAVVTVVYEPLMDLAGAHIGAHWASLNSSGDFPDIAEFEARPAPADRFDGALSDESDDVSVFVSFADTPPVPRVVVGSASGIQVALQQDSLQVSWRKLDGDTYPRFDILLAEFRKHWTSWQASLDRFAVGTMQPRQVSFTYYNELERGSGWNSPDELPNMIRLPLPRARQGRLDGFHYDEDETVIDDGGTRRRVQVHVLAGTLDSEEAAVSLNITCRGPVGVATDADGLAAAAAVCHDYAVRTFLSVTTDWAQTTWGRVST